MDVRKDVCELLVDVCMHGDESAFPLNANNIAAIEIAPENCVTCDALTQFGKIINIYNRANDAASFVLSMTFFVRCHLFGGGGTTALFVSLSAWLIGDSGDFSCDMYMFPISGFALLHNSWLSHRCIFPCDIVSSPHVGWQYSSDHFVR